MNFTIKTRHTTAKLTDKYPHKHRAWWYKDGKQFIHNPRRVK